eukprot:scaffold8259_cov143-Cylindrotheca_fusiformis.AAC.4
MRNMTLYLQCYLFIFCIYDIHVANALPMQMNIPFGTTDCLYETLNEGERVTVSVFVLSGSPLQATTIVEGPVAPLGADADMTQFQLAIQEFEKNPSAQYTSEDYIREIYVVDFEHLQSLDYEDDDVPPPKVPDSLDRKEVMARYEQAKQRREKAVREGKKQSLMEGDPNLFTNAVPKAGWYRACIKAHADTVDVEWEIRKESQFGMDEAHVLSQEEFNLRQESFISDQELEMERREEKRVFGVAAEDLQYMAKEEDFQETKAKIKELRGKLAEIQSLMQRERRRVTNHKQTNEHSHSRMATASLFETLVFIGITGFQVYTIRKWFTTGNPVLGRFITPFYPRPTSIADVDFHPLASSASIIPGMQNSAKRSGQYTLPHVWCGMSLGIDVWYLGDVKTIDRQPTHHKSVFIANRIS